MLKPKMLPLVYWPDESLNQMTEIVTEFNEELEQLVIDMFHTLKQYDGLGLAAPQVGVNKKVFVMDFDSIRSENRVEPMIMINPVVAELSDEMYECREGCLSVPGHFEKRRRAARVKMQWQDVTGETHRAELQELVAFVAMHEYDHLVGRTFVDDSTSFKAERIQKKMQKIIKRKYDAN